MEKTNCKSKLAIILLVTMLTTSWILFAIPIASGQTQTKQTVCYLGAVPNPVGINQEVLFHVGIYTRLSTVGMSWEGLRITIERPDGETDTISDITTDSTGGTGEVYWPDMTGSYFVQAHFPQQTTTETNTSPGLPTGTVMLASTSEVIELVVQDEPIANYPGHSLPTQYWTRPIDAQLREWYTISGSWLELNRFGAPIVPGNDEAPESAHILWADELYMGGLAGGTTTGEFAFSHGDAYEGKWTSRLIINGILIHTHREEIRPLEYTAVDVRTGKELWTKTFLDNRTISFGQTLLWSGYNHHGIYSYLWVSSGGGGFFGGPPGPQTWYAFDPYTGDWEFTVENVPSGSTIYDENGWIYRYNFDLNAGEGYLWSMTHLIVPFGEDSPSAGSWPPGGSFYAPKYATYDAEEMDDGELSEAAQRAYVLNFTFPTGLPGSIRGVKLGDRVFGMDMSQTEVNTWAFSLEEGKEGDILFNESWNAPDEWVDDDQTIAFVTASLDDGVAVVWANEKRQYYGFSTENGTYLWGPTEGEHYLNYYGGHGGPKVIYDGILITTGVGGIVYGYDVTNGSTLWTYEADDPYREYLFSNNWWEILLFFTDGKVYLGSTEHSAIEPMPRGAPALCLNATTGDVIWRADGLFRSTVWGGRAVIGDSVMVTFDTYDNRIYAVGKGPSETTVEAPLTALKQGESVIIRGTVMDISPGTEDDSLRLRFPKGVPAVADESMSDWMLYIYKNFECPADVEGVEVFVKIQDPNGDFYSDIVSVDSTGGFKLVWAPEIVGTYEVTALFEGSKSYYASYDTTAFVVDAAADAPGYQGPSADEIATRTVNMMPQFPYVPTAEEIAADAAQRTINMLPQYPECNPCADIPAYQAIDLVIIVLVVVVVIIGLYCCFLKKQK
ncbi:MAG: hypothetical protein CW716_10705 [Candidatus Bathyarchaeum sp.]|nr:MAG: hypothetical protein CW716_10705 [Candidatus Bathyarchaeum sp.]